MKIFNLFKMSVQPIEGSTETTATTPDKKSGNYGKPEDNQEAGNNLTGDDKVNVHNLIILDESGSMQAIYYPALTGVNETLQTIREAQKEHPGQDHFVTLITFDTSHYHKIYHNTPAKQAIDITGEQYKPCGGTPLYDAMGRAITELQSKVTKVDVVLVTVITDGYENASRKYNSQAIKSLVEEMRKSGWVFTYIGANQDVEAVAESMSINNRMAFSADFAGTREMFEKENMSRKRFFGKLKKGVNRSEIEDGYFDSEEDSGPY
ncbi:MAG: VWA domain-containing protein [Muribaculaceae bacterium]|nr:VWA domain-containing protein [Muribaculaceae bacterium]